MALKDDWKKTGQSLGGAFKGLGKNIGRSVKDGIDKIDGDDGENGVPEDDSNVFNDGSWRKTGKELGGAFANLAHSLVNTAKEGIDKIDGDDEEKKD